MLNVRGSFFGRGIAHAIKTNWRRENKAHAKYDFSASDYRWSKPYHSVLLIMQLAHMRSVRFVLSSRFVAFSCDCEQSNSFFFLGFFRIFVKANEGEISSQVHTGQMCGSSGMSCRLYHVCYVQLLLHVSLKLTRHCLWVFQHPWRCWNLARTSPPPPPPPLCLIDRIALYQKILICLEIYE